MCCVDNFRCNFSNKYIDIDKFCMSYYPLLKYFTLDL